MDFKHVGISYRKRTGRYEVWFAGFNLGMYNCETSAQLAFLRAKAEYFRGGG